MTPERTAELEALEVALHPLLDAARKSAWEDGYRNGRESVWHVYCHNFRRARMDDKPKAEIDTMFDFGERLRELIKDDVERLEKQLDDK